jgi:hypothetical protein
MGRQRIVYSGNRRFGVVLEEQAIRARLGNFDTMVGQLDRLLGVISLPRVSLGIIPEAVPRAVFTSVGFWIFDDAMVEIETPRLSGDHPAPRSPALRHDVRAAPAVSGVRRRSQSASDPRDGRVGWMRARPCHRMPPPIRVANSTAATS